MSGYNRFSSQEAANIQAFGSDVKDATILPQGNSFVIQVETAQGDFFSLPHTSMLPPQRPPSGFCAPDCISNRGSTMPDHYHVIDYEDGCRLESLQLARSTASTRPGILRLFYSLNPEATRR